MKKLILITTLCLFSSVSWSQECVEGDCENGQGAYTYANGAKYVGEFKDGKYHGQGTYTSGDGSKYVGEWKDNKNHGQGTYTFANGAKYVGEWKDGKNYGQGTRTWASGSKYVGEWKEQQDGQGTYIYANGDKYVGEWKDGKIYGQGTATLVDGNKYVGKFKDNEFHGQGVYTWFNGVKYEGEFKDGEINGRGWCSSTEGRFICDWIDGELQPYNAQEDENIKKAESVVLALHPDYIEIKESAEFHNWAKKQSQQIQNWIYNNPDNGELASLALSLYKSEIYLKTVEQQPSKQQEKVKSDVGKSSFVARKSSSRKPKKSIGSKIGRFLAEAFIEGLSKAIQVKIINEFNEPCEPTVRVKTTNLRAGTGPSGMTFRKTRVKVKTCPPQYYFLN